MLRPRGGVVGRRVGLAYLGIWGVGRRFGVGGALVVEEEAVEKSFDGLRSVVVGVVAVEGEEAEEKSAFGLWSVIGEVGVAMKNVD